MSRGNPNGASNSEVVCRWITGLDLTRRTEERWCINFDGISSAAEAALFEAPYELFDQQWAAENARRAIGRASCRARVCQYVYISVVAGSLKKKKQRNKVKTH